MSNPLQNPVVRIGLAAALSTYVTPYVVVKIVPQLKGTVNPSTGRFAIADQGEPGIGPEDDENVRVAKQVVIGTSMGITVVLFVAVGMMLAGKSTVESAAKVAA